MKEERKAMPKVLVVYKKSAYKIYFLEKRSSFYKRQRSFLPEQLNLLKKSHLVHYKTLKEIREILTKKGLVFRCVCRGGKTRFSNYDLIVTVGGDGTFLEAARQVEQQLILGVNSDPKRSVGKFCAATPETFGDILERVLKKKGTVRKCHRFALILRRQKIRVNVLNDILISHANPGAMSRYRLSVGDVTEEQRSSGLWISTAIGSSGAIYSAGGKILPWYDRRIQYRPRELYKRYGKKMKLLGGVDVLKNPLLVLSLMRQGVVCVDGEHLRFNFDLGEEVRIENSECPINIVARK